VFFLGEGKEEIDVSVGVIMADDDRRSKRENAYVCLALRERLYTRIQGYVFSS